MKHNKPSWSAFEDDDLVRRRVAAQLLDRSVTWFERCARERTGPPLVRLSEKCVRYRIGDLKRYVAAQTVRPQRPRPTLE